MTDMGHHEFMCIVLGTEGYRRYLGLDEASPKQAESASPSKRAHNGFE